MMKMSCAKKKKTRRKVPTRAPRVPKQHIHFAIFGFLLEMYFFPVRQQSGGGCKTRRLLVGCSISKFLTHWELKTDSEFLACLYFSSLSSEILEQVFFGVGGSKKTT